MALRAIHYAIGAGVTVAVYLIASSMDKKASAATAKKVEDKAKEATVTPPVKETKPAVDKPKTSAPAYVPPPPKDSSGSDRPKSSYEKLKEGLSDSSDTSSWSDFGVTSTGRIETKNEVTHEGKFGHRNLILAKVNKNTVAGHKIGLV